MNAPAIQQRRTLLRTVAAWAAAACVPTVLALDAPAGTVVLTLTGDIPVRNSPEGAAFDGPLVLIYPFDARPELRTAVYYSRAAWQLKALELR